MNNSLNVEEIFDGRLLRVPDYQRGYAWEQEHWNAFLEDLESLAVAKRHYVGTLILHKVVSEQPRTDSSGRRYETHDIVDGQQRLTTIVLLLNAIRQECLDLDRLTSLSDGIERSYLFVRDFKGERIHKLRLNRDCDKFFVDNILGDPPSPGGPLIASHRRLGEAQRRFRKYLANERSSRKDAYQEWLLHLHDKLTHRLRMSLYNVDEESDAGVIFEVMNNRGKPLSEIEKVKNYLLYLGSKLDIKPHDLGDKVNSTWANIFEQLMARDLSDSSEEDRLLRAHWIMTHDAKARNWRRSDSIKARFNLKDYLDRHTALLQDLNEYSKTLDDACVAYCDVCDPGHSNAFGAFAVNPSLRSAIIRAGEKLQRINVVSTFLPLLMAMRLRLPERGDQYLDVLRLCEIFAFRVYRLLNLRADAGQKTVFRLANELYAGRIDVDSVKRQLWLQIHDYCPATVMKERFQLKVENNWYQWPGLKYLLYEYEEHLASGEPVTVTWKQVLDSPVEQSIEHILPQSPSAQYWTSRFDVRQMRQLTHDLGNLCLTFHNSSYGKKSFPDKKGSPGDEASCYANSNLFMERKLAALQDWTPETLIARRNDMVKWAFDRWQLHGGATTDEDLESLLDQISL